jgi:1,4-dihydroxy-2-naphthoate octaprenyltransferase
MVLGVYFTQTGQYALAPTLASLVPGFLVSNLLLLNQFPDAEADLTASRRHLPIALGKQTSARVYVALLAAAYLSLVLTVAFGVLPLTALLGLLTLPLGLKAAKGVLKHYDDTGSLIPFMGVNIQVTLLMPLLMGAGILLGMLL